MLQIPSSLVTGFMFPVVGAMAGKVDARLMVVIGLVTLSASCFFLQPLTLSWGWDNFLLSSLLRGFGVVLIFLPLTLAAVGDCPTEDIQTASSLLSLSRTLGGSIGIAVLGTTLIRRNDFHRAMLVENFTVYSSESMQRLQGLIHTFQTQGWSEADARMRALAMLSNQVNTQASTLSYADLAWCLGVLLLCSLPFCVLLTSGRSKAKVEMH
jgi:DHA2 family multidrug resistance protein